MQEVEYDQVFSFKYSPRPNTLAATQGDALAEDEKGRRLAELQELQRQIQLRRNQALLGATFEVLVEAHQPRLGQAVGRSTTNRVINFPGSPSDVGTLPEGESDRGRAEQPGRSAQPNGWRLQGLNRASWVLEGRMEIEMRIRGLVMDPVTNMPIVILKDPNGASVLPIWVGIYEANAIALEIEKVTTPRPMTHDLLKNLLLGLETRVQKVVVNELKEDTFYALIWLERDGQVMSIDSRPSDALALALRMDCPIYVEEEVLKNSKVAGGATEKASNEELRKWLEGLGDEDMGRYKM